MEKQLESERGTEIIQGHVGFLGNAMTKTTRPPHLK